MIVGISVLGIIGLIVSLICNVPQDIISLASSIVGIVGTVASIVLSIVAMIYANKSSKDAENSLQQVNDNYRALCDALTSSELQGHLGTSGINKIINK